MNRRNKLGMVGLTAVFLFILWWVQGGVETAVWAEDDRVVVRAYFDEREMVNRLAARREPWTVDHDAGYLVIDVTPAEYQQMETAGFRLEIDEALTAVHMTPRTRDPLQTSGIPGYACYRTVEETLADAAAMAAAQPQLAEWIDIGDSWEKTNGLGGYDLQVLKLTNSAMPGPKPALFVMSSVHAREYAPAELNTRFAEYLIAHYGSDADVTWLLDYHEIHLLLQANPDGRKQAETGLLWRKNTNQAYCGATSPSRGADLNRNFSFSWNICGGNVCSSNAQCDETYRGPHPASEPETEAIEQYVRTIFPDQRADDLSAPAPEDATGVFLDIHSYGELVLWSWGFTTAAPPNGPALTTLGRKLAFFNGYEPDQAVGLYPTDGTTDDFAYGELGVAAYTFELGTRFFQSCAYFESEILSDNLAALLYAGKTARAPYQLPAGPDVLALSLSEAEIAAGTAVTLTVTLEDGRYSAANGVEPTQPIQAAVFTVDVPPWENGAAAVPITAVDGQFDSASETGRGIIQTAALAVGRYTIYVQAQDSDGNWGPVSAVFLQVTESALTPQAYLPLVAR